jgi:hypothetical protein
MASSCFCRFVAIFLALLFIRCFVTGAMFHFHHRSVKAFPPCEETLTWAPACRAAQAGARSAIGRRRSSADLIAGGV